MKKRFKTTFPLKLLFVMLLLLGVFSCKKEDFTPEASDDLKAAPGRNSYASSGMPGTLYFSTNTKVVALNASDGTLVWEKSGAFYPSISPVIANGRIHVLNQSGTMKTFAQQTGNLLWESDIVTLSDFEFDPVVSGGIIHFVSQDTFIDAYALNATNGKTVWSQFIDNVGELPSWLGGGTAIVEGLVFHASMAKLSAFDVNTGAKKWETSGAGQGTPTIYNKVLYISSGTQLRAVDALSGQIKWDNIYNKYTSGVGAPVYADGMLYTLPTVAPLEGYFAAFSAATGTELWNLKLDGYSTSSPTVFNGIAFAVTNKSKLYAIDLQGKKVKWSITLPVSPYKGPVVQWQVTGNAVVYVSCIGKLYAFDAWTGAKLWEYNTPGEWPSRVALPPPISNTIYSVEYPTESGMKQ